MIGWHHRLDGHESEQATGICKGQGRLAFSSPWGCKELDMTEQLNWTELNWNLIEGVSDSIFQEAYYHCDSLIHLLKYSWGWLLCVMTEGNVSNTRLCLLLWRLSCWEVLILAYPIPPWLKEEYQKLISPCSREICLPSVQTRKTPLQVASTAHSSVKWGLIPIY